MTKLELIKKLERLSNFKLEDAKENSNVVSIDVMISLLNQITEPEPKKSIDQIVIDEISSEIELCLNRNASDLVDMDNMEFSLVFGNQIDVDGLSIEVYSIMRYIKSILGKYVTKEQEDEE